MTTYWQICPAWNKIPPNEEDIARLNISHTYNSKMAYSINNGQQRDHIIVSRRSSFQFQLHCIMSFIFMKATGVPKETSQNKARSNNKIYHNYDDIVAGQL